MNRRDALKLAATAPFLVVGCIDQVQTGGTTLQLRWDTWSEMCDFAGVGCLVDGKPEGILLSGNRIGLNIPTNEGLLLVEEGQYVVKTTDGLDVIR